MSNSNPNSNPISQPFAALPEQQRKQLEVAVQNLKARAVYLQSEIDNLKKIQSGLRMFIHSLIDSLNNLFHDDVLHDGTEMKRAAGLEELLSGFDGLINTRIEALHTETNHIATTLSSMENLRSSSLVVPRMSI